MVDNYVRRTSQSSAYAAGQLAADSEAIGRLRELADEYAGTEVGAEYERQWQEAVKASDPGGHDYAEEEAMDYPPFRA